MYEYNRKATLVTDKPTSKLRFCFNRMILAFIMVPLIQKYCRTLIHHVMYSWGAIREYFCFFPLTSELILYETISSSNSFESPVPFFLPM
jgi:hypothetical protein